MLHHPQFAIKHKRNYSASMTDIKTGMLRQRNEITAKQAVILSRRGTIDFAMQLGNLIGKKAIFIFKLGWTKSYKQIIQCFKSQTFLNFEDTESWNRCLTI